MRNLIITLTIILFFSCLAFAENSVEVKKGTSWYKVGDELIPVGSIDTSIGNIKADNGVDEHETGPNSCKITVNSGDNTKIDIADCNIHVQGPRYFFNATTIDPEFAAGKVSRFIGATMNGYISQTSTWTISQEKNIIPLARLNTRLGTSGPGTTVYLIRDDRYFLTNRDYYDDIWHEEAIGALYVSGGDIFANATSGLILGQNSGVLYDAQTKRHTLATFENQSAIFLHLSSNETDWIANKKLLVVDNVNYNPAGSSLAPLLNDNKFKVDTILKSPKGISGTQEGGLFLIYGDTEYGTAAEAIAGAETRFSLFIDQSTSRLVPVALIVQQKNAVAVDTIIDKRPCFVCRP